MVDFNELLERVNKTGYITKTELLSLNEETKKRLVSEIIKLNPYAGVLEYVPEIDMWVDDKAKAAYENECFVQSEQDKIEQELYDREYQRHV